jgi:hypothetical protein
LADSKLLLFTRALKSKNVFTTLTVGSTFFFVKQSTRALSLVLKPNTSPLCLTATAGTVLVGACYKDMFFSYFMTLLNNDNTLYIEGLRLKAFFPLAARLNRA